MDWTIFVILQVILQPSLADFFTVEAEQTSYVSEFGGDVVMGCSFQPKPANPAADLKVTWHRMTSGAAQEVLQMVNGTAHAASPEYRGRVRLLTEELKDGWAKLQVSGLRINDSGTYQCLVQTIEEADYKTITLSVVAPYKAVTKHIEKAAEGEEVLLTCQSEGYPESPVLWHDGHLQNLMSKTTAVSTPDQLLRITSQIRVPSSDRNNYTCDFTKRGHSATFLVPGFSTPSTRNLLVDSREKPVSITISRTEENLGAALKAYYSDVYIGTEVRRVGEAFSADEQPHRLQNNEGQAVNLQALLPEAGDTVLLEGLPGSGKTKIAHILVSSWAEGSSPALTNLIDLSDLRLLLYVDCSKVNGDLFQEIVTQLSLTENISTQQLRTVLSGSREALLVLDGYREGNQFLDESLKCFVNEQGGCRVLVTACPGQCPMLEETVGKQGVIKLQTQAAKC
ncbi:hypothetical protein INR49_015177 [Caranx melampygus]|nr:hypothetical protein INR49_015177 [Caranx melampygus]